MSRELPDEARAKIRELQERLDALCSDLRDSGEHDEARELDELSECLTVANHTRLAGALVALVREDLRESVREDIRHAAWCAAAAILTGEFVEPPGGRR